MSTERVIDRVRKMLALAKDKGATEGERDNALRMAHATIAKYNLDMAAVEKGGQKTEEKRDFFSDKFYGRPWARVVSGACAELFFCEYLYAPATKGKDTTHIFIGKESNAKTALAMAAWLVEVIFREGSRYERQVGGGNYAARSFRMGAAIRIAQRARALREAPATPVATPGTAIVLADVYAAEHRANRELIERRYPSTRRGHSGKGFGVGAAMAGAAYGNTLNLETQVGGRTQERLK